MNILKKIYEKLIKVAEEARLRAYVPYSKFKVGAALLTKGKKIYSGCNIENASFGLAICAERVAIFKAISEGSNQFEAIAIVCDSKKPCFPCGACRQVISEFGKEIIIINSNLRGKVEIKSINNLLPDAFGKENLI